MLHWLYYLLLLVVLLCGLLLNLFTLPGNWLMLAAVAVYAWITHGQYAGWISLAILFVLAASAEVAELLAAGAGAKKEGGTRWGAIGALIGGIVGGLFLTGLIPIPILGTFIGILLGTFGGAMAGELLGGKEVGHSALIGVGAAKGRVYGTLLKLAFGCVILVVSLYATLPWSWRMHPARATPTVAPVPMSKGATK